jgi:hypothetical protein
MKHTPAQQNLLRCLRDHGPVDATTHSRPQEGPAAITAKAAYTAFSLE